MPNADPPSWPELVVLMAFGAGAADTARGTVRVIDKWPIDDDIELDDGETEGHHPEFGRVAVLENEFQLTVRGESWLVASLEGSPVVISTPSDMWFVDAETGVAKHDDRQFSAFGLVGLPDALVERPQPSRWEGDDFSRPAGPITATEFLGRPAWAVEIAPPSHKPYPRQMVIDAESGRVLSDRNDGFGDVTEWTSVEFGIDLPDDLFRWDGPIRELVDEWADDEYDHEQELAAGRERLAARGIDQLAPPMAGETMLHESDDVSGEFHASVMVDFHASVLRRVASEQPWAEVEEMNMPHVHRWRDGNWDWCVATDSDLTLEQLAALRAQLDGSH